LLNFDAIKDVEINGKVSLVENREQQFGTADIGLLVFVIVAGWLLLFQSGIFQ
jgi:hypothetical protein